MMGCPNSRSLPEKQVLLGGTWAPPSEDEVVDLGVLGQGLDDGGPEQVGLPQRLLPQQAPQHVPMGGVHLHGAAPQAQGGVTPPLRTETPGSWSTAAVTLTPPTSTCLPV